MDVQRAAFDVRQDDISTTAPTAAPTTIHSEQVVVESVLKFGLFDGEAVEVREPTEAEPNSLWDQTVLFYTDFLFGVYPNLNSFDPVLVGSWVDEVDPSQVFPISVLFDVIMDFDEGSRVPSEQEIIAVFESADYNGK